MAKATGGGGGGSKYRSTTTGGSITKLAESVDGVDPFVQISYKSASGGGSQTITETTTLSGATTDTLTIKCDSVKSQQVYCVVSGASIPSTPTTVTSDTANFYSISQSNLQVSSLTLETVEDLNSSTFTSSTQNLFQNSLTLSPAAGQSLYTWVVYSTEDVPVTVTLEGAGGKGTNGYQGGAGGRTVFDYTLKANTEYVFKLGRTEGIAQSTGGGGPAAYFYEKGKLLVVSGGGGASGTGANGGDGGGAGTPGKPGTAGAGSGAGTGGQGVLTGQLGSNGILPSGVNGGKAESCTTGYYWPTQGYSPCQDIGQVKFRDANGNQVTNSTASITRGYKADREYTTGNHGYRFNGGNSSTSTGGGGSGAYGGNASSNGVGGGGGGSGYSDGSVTVTSSGITSKSPSGTTPIPARAIITLRT